jgi:hypothetical protein
MSITIEPDRALVVIPLGALADDPDVRYVDWDSLHEVLRTYRKYVEMSDVERAIVERLSADLYALYENGARTLLELVASRGAVQC